MGATAVRKPGPMQHRQRVHDRLSVVRAALNEPIHRDNVRAWTEQNSGPYPSSVGARIQAFEELGVLIEALGPMAALDMDVMLRDLRIREPPAAWERELLGE